MTSLPATLKKVETEDTDKKSTAKSIEARLAGNKLLREKNHNNFICQEALSYFSKSMAYALPNTKELALGYNNRSILWFHLKKYDLSLYHIEQALNSFCVESELRVKLLIRKIKCLKSLGLEVSRNDLIIEIEQLISEIQIIETRQKLNDSLKDAVETKVDLNYEKIESESVPEIEKSVEIPCASNAVEIKYNQKFGRHLIVNRDISTGEILIVEKAFVGFPSLRSRYLVCSNCLNFAWTAVLCDHCPCVIYCSTLCKDYAWKKYHDIECSILQNNLITKDFQTRFIMVCRSFILALKEKNVSRTEHVLKEIKYVEENPGSSINNSNYVVLSRIFFVLTTN